VLLEQSVVERTSKPWGTSPPSSATQLRDKGNLLLRLSRLTPALSTNSPFIARKSYLTEFPFSASHQRRYQFPPSVALGRVESHRYECAFSIVRRRSATFMCQALVSSRQMEVEVRLGGSRTKALLTMGARFWLWVYVVVDREMWIFRLPTARPSRKRTYPMGLRQGAW
jgi:hypothetical protein